VWCGGFLRRRIDFRRLDGHGRRLSQLFNHSTRSSGK
jgi:hypothetical protein